MKINLFVFIISICTIATTHAQRDFSKVEVITHEVTDNIYYLEGAGGNIGVFTGVDGTIMIDSQYAPLGDKIKTAIAKITNDKPSYLINTHWHGDHTGGNENFTTDGAIIIAHDNVLERLSQDQFIKAFSREVKAKAKTYWPTMTFTEDMKVHFNGEVIMLIHVHHAHTDGDTFVWLPESNVLHMGDCFFKDRFPYIDMSSKGSFKGAIKAVETALMLVNNDTKIIPGHGSLASKFDLMRYYTMLLYTKERIEKMNKEGKSLDDIKAAGIKGKYEDWGSGFISEERWIDIVWTSLNQDAE